MTCAHLKLTRLQVLFAAACLATVSACAADAGVTQVNPRLDAGSSGGTSGASGQRDASVTFIPPIPDAQPWVEPDVGEPVVVRAPQNIESMRIDPADLILQLARGKSETVTFKAFATLQGITGEVEITDRTIFYVPDNYLVGTFPADGSSLFTTRLPASATEPPQRGGKVTIQAQAASNDIPITTVTTTLTVTIIDSGQAADGSPAATPAIPSDPGSKFTDGNSPTLAPTLVYPNDGVMLPPNMRNLEVHFLPATSKAGALYEISLLSPFSEYRFYTRCYADPLKYLKGYCVFEMDPDALDVVAESNRGIDPVTLAVRATDEAGNVGKSASIDVQFAAERVDGAIYYWTTSDPAPRIMRFDFASQSALAPAIEKSDLPDDANNPHLNQRCIGCHALSRDGKRMVASTGASWEGNLVYISDLSKPKTAADWLTVDGRGTGPASQNKVMTASFNPDGTQFVAVGPAGDGSLGQTKLAFHDGITGLRTPPFLDVGFTVSFPDWSPDGQTIAVTHIYGQNSSTIEFKEGGLSVIRRSATGWSPEEVVVPHTALKNRYTPTFVPDSSLLIYSEATQQTGDSDGLVNAYSDPSATVWAVQPQAKATPVLLARANATGVADKLTLADGRSSLVVQRISSGMLMNTYPRAAPFKTTQNGHKLFWFTVASQRRAGVRLYTAKTSVVGDEPTQVLLWMFALDADQVLAGKDGSYPGFFLPFQDMTTSNHMASWTEKYVSPNPPPEPPVVPTIPPPLTITPPTPIPVTRL
jgi:hypothetical protein